ncbi:MAG: sugar porter family MFS transporter, partial [Terracidiphilus sp.]
AFSYSANWHGMLGIIGVPGALFFMGALALPESPRWLMTRGRDDEAARVLMKLRDDPAAVASERREIAAQLRNPQHGWRLFVENKNFRRSVGLGVLLQIVQQFTGINIVMYYAPRIFESMGYRTQAQLWFTAAVGLVNVLATLIAVRFVDKWGRKPILYSGFATMAIGLGVVGAMMHTGMRTESAQLLAVAMLLVFIVGFACSAGPVIWILCSEIQPIQGREFGMSLATMSNWLSNFVIDGTFLTVLKHFGRAPTFWLYTGLNVAFLFVVVLLVPETKNVTLEFIERNLMAGKRLRQIGR